MVSTGIICITLIILAKMLPNSFTLRFEKTIRVIEPPQPTITPVKHSDEPEVSMHDSLLGEINTIMSNLNGGQLE